MLTLAPTARVPSFGYEQCVCLLFFFFNDTATTEIYPLPLHDALPISGSASGARSSARCSTSRSQTVWLTRSEEHTSELQSQSNLVCRLLLEKKKNRYRLCNASVAKTQEIQTIRDSIMEHVQRDVLRSV